MPDQPKEAKSPEAKSPKKYKIDFYAILAHDLKSPLNTIEATLELMRGKVLGENVDLYVPLLDKCINRMNDMREMIRDVADLWKIKAGDLPRNFSRIELGQLVRTVIDSASTQAQQKDVTISLATAEEIAIEAVREEILLIVGHLIANAVKYNKQHGTVSIGLTRQSQYLCVEVNDTGIGMSAEESLKIGKEFVRIKNSKTVGIPGTGLGLAIAKRLADLYHGTITIESVPDQGSKFSLCLPLSHLSLSQLERN